MAYIHFHFLSLEQAEQWYSLCLEVAPTSSECFVECSNEASRLVSSFGYEAAAWDWSRRTLSLLQSIDDSLSCSIALQASRAALNSLDNFNAHKYALGYALMLEAEKKCNERKLLNLHESECSLFLFDRYDWTAFIIILFR
mmetsp:Transcript_2268/g.4688  ORF Transcript_2268/g.4688 Transcript_2268/m.4688 type:complete len:141 (-) Transcript_2268:692-1114(-)